RTPKARVATRHPRRTSALATATTPAVPARIRALLMQITCAECGCVVDRGEIVGPCGQHPECCCRDLGSRDDTRERLHLLRPGGTAAESSLRQLEPSTVASTVRSGTGRRAATQADINDARKPSSEVPPDTGRYGPGA